MLGYSRIRSLPAPPWSPPRARAFHCDIAATGMGPACPFGAAAYSRGELSTTSSELPLVFETETPLFHPGAQVSKDREAALWRTLEDAGISLPPSHMEKED